MTNWRNHIVFGAILTILVFYFVFSLRDFFQLFILTSVGGTSALVPDLDHDTSKGRKIADVLVILFAGIFSYYIYINAPSLPNLFFVFFAIIGVYFVLFKIFKPRHRGITHTLFANAIFSIFIFLVFGMSFAIAGLVGYFSHLIADRCIKLV
ncbi:metal-dependent hydrolase [Candidatus Micrarchaeota archaeon]|nr:metal-dependent hydrolase [Candidatus Micrarchaeota archaeon]